MGRIFLIPPRTILMSFALNKDMTSKNLNKGILVQKFSFCVSCMGEIKKLGNDFTKKNRKIL